MAGIHIVAPCAGPLSPSLGLLPLVLAEELLLLVRVGLPQEAGDLVVADADPLEQVLHATGLVTDAEGVLKPLANLVGVAEATGADLVFELLDLARGKLAGVALVMEGTEVVEALVAIDPEPFAQLGETDSQQLSDFFPGLARSNSQDSGEPLVNTPVQGSLAAAFDLSPLLSSQDNRFHERRPWLAG